MSVLKSVDLEFLIGMNHADEGEGQRQGGREEMTEEMRKQE